MEAIADRVFKNAQWASMYLGYFESCNRFLRKHHPNLDGNANELLSVLDRGLPRLAVTCLARMWDRPSTDRHSLLTLIGMQEFQEVASKNDSNFISDCEEFSNSEFLVALRDFRNRDLAHNLEIGSKADGSLTLDKLRTVLASTHSIVDRLATIFGRSDADQRAIQDHAEQNSEQFWLLIESKIVTSSSADCG